MNLIRSKNCKSFAVSLSLVATVAAATGAVLAKTTAPEATPQALFQGESMALKMMNEGHLDDAIGFYDRLQAVHPSARVLVNRAICKERQSDYPGMLADSSAALKMEPGAITAMHVRAVALWHMNRRGDAIAEMKKAIKTCAHAANSYAMLSDFYACDDKPQLALDCLTTGIKVKGLKSAELHKKRALVGMQFASDRNQLMADLKVWQKAFPKDAQVYQWISVEEFNNESYAAARDNADKSIALGESSAAIFLLRGMCEEALNDPKAKDDFTRAAWKAEQGARSNSKDALSLAFRSVALSKLCRFEEAFDCAARSMSCSDEAFGHYAMALALQGRGDLEGSRAELRLYLNLSPYDKEAARRLSVVEGTLLAQSERDHETKIH